MFKHDLLVKNARAQRAAIVQNECRQLYKEERVRFYKSQCSQNWTALTHLALVFSDQMLLIFLQSTVCSLLCFLSPSLIVRHVWKVVMSLHLFINLATCTELTSCSDVVTRFQMLMSELRVWINEHGIKPVTGNCIGFDASLSFYLNCEWPVETWCSVSCFINSVQFERGVWFSM